MSADSSEIDAAVVAKLAGDATLIGVLTDGVWVDQAPEGSTKFAIVTLQHETDVYVQPAQSAFEDGLYLVKAVVRATDKADIKVAAARIQALLQDATLSITGYRSVNVQRVERIRYSEVDDVTNVIWQHRGGLYQVLAQPS